MNKSLKRALCFALCLCLLGSGSAFSQQEDGETAEAPRRGNLAITNLDQFLRFAENCQLDEYSRNLDVRLTTDIDLSGTDFAGIPIFRGSFNGQGNSITGLNLIEEGSEQGLFRYVTEGAVVKNLVVEGRVVPTGSRRVVGGIAGSNAGRISNCKFGGSVEAADMVGGIAGKNLLTGIVEMCSIRGEVSGSHFVGGIVGDNAGVVRHCDNYARINTSVQENKVELDTLSVDVLTGSEDAATVTDVGGIVGSSRGIIRACVNHGAVGYKLMGYNIGGIVGSQQGYVLNCENMAAVAGRKEVGGIVGQMEPAAYIAFEQDAIQILNQQLDGLSGIVGQAATNAQIGGGYMAGGMGELMGDIQTTGAALGVLAGGVIGSGQIDPGTYEAARAAISSGLADMTGTMQGLAATTQSVMGTLSNDLYAMQAQVNAMRATLGNISDTVGGSLKDRSDEDTEEQHTGKVAGCVNSGSVEGELNVGGISGAIAVENDFDTNEDYTLGENNSLNFVSELRAVILNCDNTGPVSVLRMNGGGIVGWMQMGLAKACINSAQIQGDGADYVGGIAGLSEAYIRACSSNCLISAESAVGGIAGQGSTVSDCRSMVKLHGEERVGAILGYGEQSQNEEGALNISDNFYFAVEKDPGGIDGISYEGVAKALTQWDFYTLEGLSDIFSKVYLRFEYEDGTVTTVDIPAGGKLEERRIPPLPEKPGYIAQWADFENLSYDFDESFQALYIPYSSTLESRQQNEAGLALLLAEGSFLPESQLDLTELTAAPALEQGERLIATGGYISSDGSKATRLRYLLSEPVERLRSYAYTEDGQWQECRCSVLGSYAVIELSEAAEGFALVQGARPAWQYVAVGGGAAAVLLATLLIICAKRRRKKQLTALSATEEQ